MWESFVDGMKAVVILVLITSAVLVLPFFLIAVAVLFIGYIIYLVVHAIRLEKEKEKANAKAKESEQARAAAKH